MRPPSRRDKRLEEKWLNQQWANRGPEDGLSLTITLTRAETRLFRLWCEWSRKSGALDDVAKNVLLSRVDADLGFETQNPAFTSTTLGKAVLEARREHRIDSCRGRMGH